MIRKFRLLTLFVIMSLAASACNLNTNRTLNAAVGDPAATTTVEMIVQADTSAPFNTVGQIIQYKYGIKNSGATPLPGTVSVTGATVTCPAVNTIGNLDTFLDTGEILICASTYAITQADLDKGSITSITTANVNGTLSSPVTTTVTTVPSKLLTLTKSANPLTYDHVGQTITYTYTIKNSGSLALGPAQFTVTDAGIVTPINCGDANTTLAPAATVTCSAAYVTTQTDLNVTSIATNASASGGGAGPSQTATIAVTKSNVSQPNPSATANPALTPGKSIQHTVVAGEWLWQIARCYGVDPKNLIAANPQLPNPAQISPNTIITVPSIGSNGQPIYGPPCVVTYTVVAGDTWNSIAQNPKHNADLTVLQRVNPGDLSVGRVLTIPRNSATAGSAGGASGSDLIRINFAAGATSSTQSGTALAGNRPSRYVLTASQGQVLTVKLTASANSASLAIFAPNGSTLKAADLVPNWTGTLAASGEYRIEVYNSLGLGAPNVPFTLEVSVTGNCVDQARSLKLVGAAAATTHFNICGTIDAAGKTKISTIQIYQRPEDVGLGGLSQSIPVSIVTATPLNDATSLIVGDMNYDGNDDFRIMRELPAGPNIPYLCYLFDPNTRQFVYNDAFSKITAPQFPGNSQIVSQWRESAVKWGTDTYTITNNVPTLTRRETWEAINATQATHRVIVFNADGTSQVLVDEVIPIP